MAISLAGLRNIYDAQVKALIEGSNQQITLRLPVVRVSSNVNRLFGDTDRETDTTGTVKGPFNCLWYDALSATSRSATGSGHESIIQELAGQYQSAVAFAELRLADVLVSSSDTTGDTWFDRAKDVLYNGQNFKYVASVRLGLSIGAPVLLMIVLEGGRGYDD